MKAIAILLFFFVLYSNEQIPAQNFYGISIKSDAKIKGFMEKHQSIAQGNEERCFSKVINQMPIGKITINKQLIH